MRIVSWNVWWRFGDDWQGRQRRIIEQLHDLAPDVIALQEVWRAPGVTQADVIGRALGMDAVFAGPSLPPVPDPPETAEQGGVDLGVALLSRLPITEARRERLPSTHRAFEPVVLRATLEHPDGPLHVFTTATEWEPRFADDHLAQTRRLAELVTNPDLDGPLPVLLAADLNARPDSPELRPLFDVMLDTWGLAGADPHVRTLRSENPLAPSNAPKQIDERIDYVLARPTGASAPRVDRSFVAGQPSEGIPASDHDAVVADIDLST